MWTTLGEISNYGQCENVDVDKIAANEWILELEDIEKDSGHIIQKLCKDDRKACGTRHKFYRNEILYSKLRTYLNKVLVAPSSGFCTSEIIPIHCIETNPWFICFVLRSNYFLDYTASLGYGVKMPRLGTNDALISYIPLPPLSEQARIVDEVAKWNIIIDEIEDDKLELEAYVKKTKSKILDLAISGKLVPQDPNDEPAIELLKRINPGFEPCDNSHYENLPQGWAVCRLSDMVRIQNGFAFQSAKYIDVGIRIIRITNVQSGYIIDESPKFYPHNLMVGLDEYNLKNGDLLMSLTGNVGRVGIMPENLLPAALNQRVCCIKPKNNDIDKMYLFYYFQAEQFIQDCIASGKGVAQLNVSTEWLKHYIIQLPPKEEQSRIVKTIDALFSIIDKITAEL